MNDFVNLKIELFDPSDKTLACSSQTSAVPARIAHIHQLFCLQIKDGYRVDKEGTLTGPANETLMTALQAKEFMAE